MFNFYLLALAIEIIPCIDNFTISIRFIHGLSAVTLLDLGGLKRTISPLKRVTRRSRNEGSWLADSQMHKVGYPNLNVTYSEEDSRDAADVHENVEVGF